MALMYTYVAAKKHPFTFIKSRAWLYFVHWPLWLFTLDEMRMKTAFTPFTSDKSSAMHIQSVKCKFALWWVNHCTQGMARLQFVVEVMDPSMKGICECIQQANADSEKWVVIQAWGLGEMLTIPSKMLQCSQLSRAWIDPLSHSKQWNRDMRFGTWAVRYL
jgi:hypothetical protein